MILFMMKFICISLVCLVGLFAGCSQEPPLNFVCTQTGDMYPPKSLSLEGGKAVLGSVTYEKFCTKSDNFSIYGLESDDCENRKMQSAYAVRVLSIDVISGALVVLNKSPQNDSIGTTYQCLRVK